MLSAKRAALATDFRSGVSPAPHRTWDFPLIRRSIKNTQII